MSFHNGTRTWLETLKNIEKNESKIKKKIHLSGATTGCMESYIKPTLRRNTDKFILHIRTNDLRSKKEPLEIASKQIRLAKTCRENGWDTII